MANEIPLTLKGNLTSDPELRYMQSGVAVANVSIAHTPRIFDRQTNSWTDGDTVFLRGSVWREYGEHVAASLVKGQRVIVSGSLTQRSYKDRDGNDRTAYEIEIDEIGPSLRYGTTVFTKSASGQQNAQVPAQQAPQVAAPAAQQAPVNYAQQAPAYQQAPAAPAQPAYTGVAAGSDPDVF